MTHSIRVLMVKVIGQGQLVKVMGQANAVGPTSLEGSFSSLLMLYSCAVYHCHMQCEILQVFLHCWLKTLVRHTLLNCLSNCYLIDIHFLNVESNILFILVYSSFRF